MCLNRCLRGLDAFQIPLGLCGREEKSGALESSVDLYTTSVCFHHLSNKDEALDGRKAICNVSKGKKVKEPHLRQRSGGKTQQLVRLSHCTPELTPIWWRRWLGT
jgi:hypothetical protein